MNFLVFLLQNLSNLLMLMAVPKDSASDILLYFATANLCFSLSFTLYFSSELLGRNTSRYLFVLVFLSSFVLCFNDVKALMVAYTFMVLVSDYVISQMATGRRQLISRLIVAFSGLIFLFDSDFDCLLQIRFFLLIALSIFHLKNFGLSLIHI